MLGSANHIRSKLHLRSLKKSERSSSTGEDISDKEETKWGKSRKNIISQRWKMLPFFMGALLILLRTVTKSTNQKEVWNATKNFSAMKTDSQRFTVASAAQSALQSLLEAKSHTLTPLRSIDKNKYTIRMNTWRRNKQLIASVRHYSTCPDVQQIQIVWCDKENQPPQEILDLTKEENARVVVEYHEKNSLNERFNVLSKTETLGILSVDDDVLRPCVALDDGFFMWTDNPERMVGYDYRLHYSQDDKWNYAGLKRTKKEGRYSMSLTRFCFLHVDYLNLYMRYMPKEILDTVDKNFNCEDIAMSFFISSLTNSQVPLLAGKSSRTSMVKLPSKAAISKTSSHREKRNACVDRFAYLLGLKDGYKELSDRDSAAKKWASLESAIITRESISAPLVPDNEQPRREEISRKLAKRGKMKSYVKKIKRRLRQMKARF